MNAHNLDIPITKGEIANRLQYAFCNSQIIHEVDPDLIQKYYGEKPKRASILIPLLKKNNLWHILYTRRTSTLPVHGGQVAFPGGRMDKDDVDEENTALREAMEEIGLKPEDVNVLGRLQNFVTVTNYLVTPVVGVIPWPYKFEISVIEVSKVFTIPITWLANKENYHTQYRKLPKNDLTIPVIYYDEYKGEVLWGASARITVCFIDILLNKYKKAG